MLSIKRRLDTARQGDSGFTLIELAVVILIIGILLAIAIPTFLGIRRNAQNKAAQSSIRTVLTAAKAKASDQGTYVDMLVTDVQADEKSITIDGVESKDNKHVSAVIDAAGNLILAAQAQPGVCFVLVDNISGETTGTKYGKKATVCTASDADLQLTLQDSIKAGWKG